MDIDVSLQYGIAMKSNTVQSLVYALVGICFLTFSIAFCSCSEHHTASGAFVTVWKGVKDSTLRIPIVGNYTVTWYAADTPNDRHTETVSISQEDAHSFPHPYTFTPPQDGEYVVEVSPEGVEYMQMGGLVRYGTFSTSFESVDTVSFGSALSLLSVLQFGKVRWKSMKAMFAGCENMTFADTIDTPDLSEVDDMQRMFSKCKVFNAPLEHWNVSGVADMYEMFYGCSTFNQPLAAWDVSRVENMRGMFYGCYTFNQPLEGWKVSHVTSMGGMFAGCSNFNHPLAAWDVSHVTNMEGMLAGCYAFNQPLEGWNVSRVTNMSGMFAGCYTFNQPLERWNVSHVTEMGAMFAGCSTFNHPLAAWDVSRVTDMNTMFLECRSFNQPLDAWNVSSVVNMEGMFQSSAFNQPLLHWKLNAEVYVFNMFHDCPAAKQPMVAKWKVAGYEL